MLNDFLKEAVSIILGKNISEIAILLFNKKHVNEFQIAKKLELTINQTRNLLYKLSDYGLVSFIRKKDKRKGWYTYFWKLEVLKTLEFLKQEKIKRINQINNQIKNRETKDYYICKRCNIEVNAETALLNNFTCNECGDIFTRKDNSKILRELKKASDKISKEIHLIDDEILKEKQKLEKIKQKQIAKEKVEKAKKREEKRKERAKAKKKAEKSSQKKTKKKTGKKKPVKKKLKKVKKKVVKKKVAKKKPVKKKLKSTQKKKSKKIKKKK